MSDPVIDPVVDPVVDPPKVTEPAPKAPEPKTYTEDEVKLLLQKEGDRRVTPISEKLHQIQSEYEEFKKAQMTEADRVKYEKEQEINTLRKVAQDNAVELTKFKTLAEASKRGWDESVLGFLMSDDEVIMREKADKLQQLIDAEALKRASDNINKTKPTMPSNTNGVPQAGKINIKDVKSIYDAVKSGKLSLYDDK